MDARAPTGETQNLTVLYVSVAKGDGGPERAPTQKSGAVVLAPDGLAPGVYVAQSAGFRAEYRDSLLGFFGGSTTTSAQHGDAEERRRGRRNGFDAQRARNSCLSRSGSVFAGVSGLGPPSGGPQKIRIVERGRSEVRSTLRLSAAPRVEQFRALTDRGTATATGCRGTGSRRTESSAPRAESGSPGRRCRTEIVWIARSC